MASATTASAVAGSKNANGKYECSECGETFDSPQAFGGHHTKHMHERERNEPPKSSVKAEVAEELRGIVAPIQAKLVEVDTRIDRTARELRDLREAKQQLEGVLKRLGVIPKATYSSSASSAREVANRSLAGKLATMRQLVASKPELFVEGVTANALADYWKENKLKPSTSLATVRACFETLRDEGVLRADRVTKGGGMSWKLVNTNNGGSDGS
jgi:hypothetical protein